MKKIYLFSVALLFTINYTFAQWAFVSGTNDISNTNSGNVSVGANSLLQKFAIKSPGTNSGGSSTDYDFGITDGAAFQLQLLGLVNTAGGYGLFQAIKGGVGPANLVLQTQGGNVGIGTTSPGAKLELNTGGAGIASDGLKVFHSANSGYSVLNVHSEYGNGGGGSLATISNFDGTKFLIDNIGNVGVGTTSPRTGEQTPAGLH